jgi:hypothetical protein
MLSAIPAVATAHLVQDWVVQAGGGSPSNHSDDRACALDLNSNGTRVFVVGQRAWPQADWRHGICAGYDASNGFEAWRESLNEARYSNYTAVKYNRVNGLVYVVGSRSASPGTDWDFLTLALNPADGHEDYIAPAWNTAVFDELKAIDIDPSTGNVYVTGVTTNYSNQNIVVMAYNSDLTPRWGTPQTIDLTASDVCCGIVYDNGYVYVGGTTFGSPSKYLIAQFNAANGTPGTQWDYVGMAHGMAADRSTHTIYLTGEDYSSPYINCVTMRIQNNTALSPLVFHASVGDNDCGLAATVAANHTLWIAGREWDASGREYGVSLSYANGTGSPNWRVCAGGSFNRNMYTAVATGEGNRPYFTGAYRRGSASPYSSDYLTVARDRNSTWHNAQLYNGTGDSYDTSRAIAVYGFDVYVTGWAQGPGPSTGVDWDFATIKYKFIAPYFMAWNDPLPAAAIPSNQSITPSVFLFSDDSMQRNVRIVYGITEATRGQVFVCTSGAATPYPGDSLRVTFATWAAPHDAGRYAMTCSIYTIGDSTGECEVQTDSFTVTASATPGWQSLADLPTGPRGKRVKDGAALVAGAQHGDTAHVIALKGNKTSEMYSYNTLTGGWQIVTDTPCPPPSRGYRYSGLMAATPASYQSKHARDDQSTTVGSKVLIRENPGRIDIVVHDDADTGWTAHEVPSGIGPFKKGSALTAVLVATPTDTLRHAFALLGSGRTDFYRYTVETNAWAAMTSAPLGTSGKGYKDGSCLTSDGENTVYALKGNYNEFYAYNVATNSWTAKTSLPLVGTMGKKKKAGSGAAMTWLNGSVYVQKGKNTAEVWHYDPMADAWTQVEDMPLGPNGKKVKGGGALAAVDGSLYAFKGNNTLEFYRYTPLTADGSQPAANGRQVLSDKRSTVAGLRLAVSPNPFSGASRVSLSLPRSGAYSVRLYDAGGRLVRAVQKGHAQAGMLSFQLKSSGLPGGIYLLRLETQGNTLSTKVVIE